MNGTASIPDYKKMYDRVSVLAQIGVWECDLATGQLTWTDTVYDIFGISRGTPIDRETTLQIYEPKSRREMEQLRSEAIEHCTGFACDIQINPNACGARWVRLTAEVEQEAGKPVRIFGTKQDITTTKTAQLEMQALQAELIHLSRASAMGAMASTIAHELNQPLAAISNYLSAARHIVSRGVVSSELNRCMDGALEATLRSGRIISFVREMTRKGVSKKGPVEVGPILTEALKLANIGIEHLTVSWDVAPNLIVLADRVQIQQVIINLIRNACDAAGEMPCTINIKASSAGAEIEICVSDNGPGIPTEILAQIFEVFVSTKTEGLGVGLSISRTIVEAHGGHIKAENLPAGGALVCFTLPRICHS